MNKLVGNIRYTCIVLMLLLTSCFRDGLEECPSEGEYYSYIKFIYDYNMAFEDLFHRQVSRVDVYLFDSDGVFMQKLTDRVPDGSTFPRGYVLGLPEEYKDVAQFVTFPGIREEQISVTNMFPGESTINDLQVALNSNSTIVDHTISHSLKPLWYGTYSLTGSQTAIARNDTTVIPLTKNTNTFRIVLQSLDENLTIDVNDFSFSLSAVNSNYDAYNATAGTTVWKYTPYFTYNDASAGAVAELSTMRLLSDRENKLVIKNNGSSSALLDINLNSYINALRLNQYSSMSLQEYMDREDEYGVIIFLTKDEESASNRWVVGQISINSWIIRNQSEVGIE